MHFDFFLIFLIFFYFDFTKGMGFALLVFLAFVVLGCIFCPSFFRKNKKLLYRNPMQLILGEIYTIITEYINCNTMTAGCCTFTSKWICVSQFIVPPVLSCPDHMLTCLPVLTYSSLHALLSSCPPVLLFPFSSVLLSLCYNFILYFFLMLREDNMTVSQDDTRPAGQEDPKTERQKDMRTWGQEDRRKIGQQARRKRG